MNNPLVSLTKRIRHDILTITTTAGSGHPTSSLSAVEMMTVLFFKHLRYDMKDPKNPNNDRVIFSKGHASPLYYSLYAASGVISREELLRYRTFDSVLEGHPTERFAYTEAATGSLGQGLSIGLGEALALRMQFGGTNTPRVFVLAGDGEIAEGSIWEAAAAASYKNVDNLFLFVDVNRLGQSDPTMYGHDVTVFQKRFDAFGWRVIVIEDGNSLESVEKAFEEIVIPDGRPTVILAKTKKGAGISFIEDKDGWHGKPLSKDELQKALAELGEVDMNLIGTVIPAPEPESGLNALGKRIPDQVGDDMLVYDKPTATRKAFGNALKSLGESHPEIVAIDGDTKNSTYIDAFGKAFPDRFVELFIAEQNMAGVAVGFSARGYHPVVASFACFLHRAADQIRMAAFSGSNIVINGSHAGVSIGEDGPSQMGLEDISLFRSVRGSTVLYPSDAISTERLTELALNQKGIVYIRTSRPETPILYNVEETFAIGGSKTFELSVSDSQTSVTVISAGVTLHEALKAQKVLANEHITVRVIDCYSIKPIDIETLKKASRETHALIVVEDHYSEGGLGEAVQSALAQTPSVPVYHLAVTKTPRSGKTTELLAFEEIDSTAIVKKIKEVI